MSDHIDTHEGGESPFSFNSHDELNFDFNYQPTSYWPQSRTPEQLLANIKGEVRRGIARGILQNEGFVGLKEFLSREELNESDRVLWGRVDPACMGGEYLSSLQEGKVEIARISLNSITYDQISIRAKQVNNEIRYSVVNKYDCEAPKLPPVTHRPLKLGELISMIDAFHDQDFYAPYGIMRGFWEETLEGTEDILEAMSFATISSAYYPELANYYTAVAIRWAEEKFRESND